MLTIPNPLKCSHISFHIKHVEAYAKDEQLFFKDFAAAFSKLLELGVPFAKGAQQQPAEKKKGWW